MIMEVNESMPPKDWNTIRNKVFLYLGAYFASNLVMRVLISPSVAFDESEMVVATQTMAWGYVNPPPLYPWIQSIFFSVLGVSVFALALVKNLALFGFYCSTYFCAKEVFRDQKRALLAALLIFLIPTFAWEALRSQTHSVLATLMASLTLLLLLRLLKQPSLKLYLGLGLTAGLGVLSYYNFTLFAGALGLASLSTTVGRRRLLSWKSGLTLSVLVIVLTPHSLWFLKNQSYISQVAGKLAPQHSLGTSVPIVGGLLSLLLALVSFFGLLLVVSFWVLRASKSARDPGQSLPISSILGRTATLIILFSALIVVITGATQFKDRWLEPLLFFVPIYILTVAGRQIDMPQFRRFTRLAVAISLAALLVLHVRVPMAGLLDKVFPLNYPAPEIARLLRQGGFSEGLIVAENQVIGGNLRLSFPTTQVIVPFRMEKIGQNDRPTMVVWEPSKGDAVPEILAEFTLSRFELDLSRVEFRSVTAPYLYASERRTTLKYALLTESTAGNR